MARYPFSFIEWLHNVISTWLMQKCVSASAVRCVWISCTALALHFEVYGLCCTFYVIVKYTICTYIGTLLKIGSFQSWWSATRCEGESRHFNFKKSPQREKQENVSILGSSSLLCKMALVYHSLSTIWMGLGTGHRLFFFAERRRSRKQKRSNF